MSGSAGSSAIAYARTEFAFRDGDRPDRRPHGSCAAACTATAAEHDAIATADNFVVASGDPAGADIHTVQSAGNDDGSDTGAARSEPRN